MFNLKKAVRVIQHKLNSSDHLNYSIIHSDSLDNGLADLRRMDNVSATNPMIFGRYPFYDKLPFIITNKYVYRPPKKQIVTNVLLIGIGGS